MSEGTYLFVGGVADGVRVPMRLPPLTREVFLTHAGEDCKVYETIDAVPAEEREPPYTLHRYKVLAISTGDPDNPIRILVDEPLEMFEAFARLISRYTPAPQVVEEDAGLGDILATPTEEEIRDAL